MATTMQENKENSNNLRTRTKTMRSALLSRTAAALPSSRSSSPIPPASQSSPTSAKASEDMPPAPTICITTATPNTSRSEPSDFSLAAIAPFASPPPPVPPLPANVLAPRTNNEADGVPKRKLVPKKSKLSLLNPVRKEKSTGDFSDITRRLGGDASLQRGASGSKGGFEIYVDPTDDPDMGEIVMVRKTRPKARTGLDGMSWGALGEVTNVPKAAKLEEKEEGKENGESGDLKAKNKLLQVDGKGSQKWWSIGRARKDSENKEKEKEEKKIKFGSRAKTPEPFEQNKPEGQGRARFGSLDSGILLSSAGPSPSTATPTTEQLFGLSAPSRAPFGASATTNTGGLPPATQHSVPIAHGSTPPLVAYGVSTTSGGNEGPSAPPFLNHGMRTVSAGATMMLRPTPPTAINTGSVGRTGLAPPMQMQRAHSEGVGAGWGFLAVPGAAPVSGEADDGMNAANTGSIAIRAMRSMRSIAALGAWAKEKEKTVKEPKKKKEKRDKDGGKAQTVRNPSGSSFEAGALSSVPGSPPATTASRTVEKKKSILGLGLGLGWPSTVRSAASPVAPSFQDPPASVKLVSASKRYSAESAASSAADSNRLSADSAASLHLRRMASRARAGSRSTVSSTGSSLRPMSTSSGISTSSGNSGSNASVRWDEERLETVREVAKRERKEGTTKGGKSSRRASGEGRKRASLASVFSTTQPGVQHGATRVPVVNVESATEDGHYYEEDDEDAEQHEPSTPEKKTKQRPASEQMLSNGRSRAPQTGPSVKSILDAATDELACLIDRLDLEATPATPDVSPFRPLPISGAVPDSSAGSPVKKPDMESPLKKTGKRLQSASITSLRPYSQTRGHAKETASAPTSAHLVGRQIAPWPVSPPRAQPPSISRSHSANAAATRPTGITQTPPGWRPGHRRTLSPPMPAADPAPVFKPLRPSTTARRPLLLSAKSSPAGTPAQTSGHSHTPSSQTFGTPNTKIGNRLDGKDAGAASPTPVFKRTSAHVRQCSRLVPRSGEESPVNEEGMPLPPDAKRGLALQGTMGGSQASGISARDDGDEPDSDIPDELQVILSGQSEDELTRTSFQDTLSRLEEARAPSSSPGLPPKIPLPHLDVPQDATSSSETDSPVPIFQALVTGVDGYAASCPSSPGSPISENDTKKSFDFTGELQKLNESGGSDRRSFVEQLENAFRTPAKIDLRYGFGEFLAASDAPPVPKLPSLLPSVTIVEHSQVDMEVEVPTSPDSSNGMHSVPVDTSLQTEEDSVDLLLFVGAHEAIIDESAVELQSEERAYKSSVRSKASDGRLDVHFKFGGAVQASPSSVPRSPEEEPLTLSSIIPPPHHVRALSGSSIMEEDSEVLKSIFAKATAVPDHAEPSTEEEDSAVLDSIYAKAAEVEEVPRQTRPPAVSNASSKRQAREQALASLTSRHNKTNSGISFVGFDSFAEVRRAFEFGPNRPAFYPPQQARATKATHGREASMFSIASISSYGSVVNDGVHDPFGYSDRSRPSSADVSSLAMSFSVDDTFSFLNHDPHYGRRQRVDSDASSFYFHTAHTQAQSRSHRRNESSFSMASISGPPVSMYNRSFGAHRRSGSRSSASSVAMSYEMHGAHGGRAAWARAQRQQHRRDASVASDISAFSMARLGRPGLGDKMLDSAPMGEYGAPLTSITASPPESACHSASNSISGSVSRYQPGDRTSYDSIMDNDRRSMMEDSLFEKTGHRTSVSSEFVFGAEDSRPSHGLLPAFRPLSVLSYAESIPAPRDDDTMITMFDGGHVRRQSIGSVYDGSPCVQVEKRNPIGLKRRQLFEPVEEPEVKPSPRKGTLVQQPSIASTSSSHFGGERMIKARHGLLQRQSLEESCLSAEGEDDLTSSHRDHPSFTRTSARSRPRSNTYASSGAETPPLSACDESSEGGSMSSVDFSQINAILANATHPMSGAAASRARARARGRGHRRRISEARMSRSSVYETIVEEAPSPMPPRGHERLPSVASVSEGSLSSALPSPALDSVFIVENERDRESGDWTDDRGITALRRYYALRNEAHETVEESKRLWLDTPFSLFALQSFEPPEHPEGMQAMLQHSQEAYGPLPYGFRMRSRKNSRASPYPSAIQRSVTVDSPDLLLPAAEIRQAFSAVQAPAPVVLQAVAINSNMSGNVSAIISPKAKSKTPKVVEDRSFLDGKENLNAKGLPAERKRVTSSVRRSALGWSKRSTGNENRKENSVVISTTMNPPSSLRINRPRPRGRPTPARPNQTIRV